MSLFQVTKKQVIENYELRTMTGDIVSFTPSYSQLLPDPFSDLNVTVNVLATGGNGTPDNPIPINGYTEANIVNTQNESIVDLFSIDSDFRGTVAFNQLVKTYRSNASYAGVTLTNNTNYVHLQGLTTAENNITVTAISYGTIPQEHKFLAWLYGVTSSDLKIVIGLPGLSSNYGSFAVIGQSTGTTMSIALGFKSGVSIDNDVRVNCIDLTQMFGSTIADYIYTLEQNNAGAGVAFFRSIYPDDYYDYDVGTTEIVGKETPEATIAFGQTVYGGQLIILPDRTYFHVTHGSKLLNDNIAWTLSAQDYWYTTALSNVVKRPPNNATKADALAEQYTNDTFNNVYATTPNTIGIQSNGTVAAYNGDSVNTPQGLFIYELATPFDIDLTPEVISAVVGTNNVFAGCGETTVTCLI